MKRLLRVAVLAMTALSLAGAALVMRPAPAGAVSGIEAGSWWAGQVDGNPVPAPATVPPGGLWVSYNASGEVARSALRFTLAAREAFPMVTLRVHNEAPPNGAGVMACAASSGWNPVDAGATSAEPKADCAQGSVVGARGANGTMVFDLATMFTTGPVDIVFLPSPPASGVPAPPAPAPNVAPATSPAPFDITFEPPTAGDIAVGVLPAFDESAPSAAAPADDQSTFFSAPLFEGFSASPQPANQSPSGAGVDAPRPPVQRFVPAASQAPAFVVIAARTRMLFGLIFLNLAAWWFYTSVSGQANRRATLYADGNATEPASGPRREGRAPRLR